MSQPTGIPFVRNVYWRLIEKQDTGKCVKAAVNSLTQMGSVGNAGMGVNTKGGTNRRVSVMLAFQKTFRSEVSQDILHLSIFLLLFSTFLVGFGR